MRPIILGMNNPKSADPLKVLCPTDAPGSAGNRLWNLSGMTETAYLLAFERRNLLPMRWDDEEAKVAARKFLESLQDGQVVVYLGMRVWRALVWAGMEKKKMWREKRIKFYSLPHPSGRNLYYNDPVNRAKVGRLLRRLAR